LKDDISDETIEIIVGVAYYAMTSPSFRPQIQHGLGLRLDDLRPAIDLIGKSINGDIDARGDFLSVITGRIRTFFKAGGIK
jgi:hypothetical protein